MLRTRGTRSDSESAILLAWGKYLLGVPSQIVGCFGSRTRRGEEQGSF
jgi:hypothetical protein